MAASVTPYGVYVDCPPCKVCGYPQWSWVLLGVDLEVIDEDKFCELCYLRNTQEEENREQELQGRRQGAGD